MPRYSFLSASDLRLRSFFCLFFALAVIFAPASPAMSVVAPTFEQLVAASDTIVRGTVTAIRSEEFDSSQGRGIRTLVTLRVERALKGSTADTVTISLLGGTVGKRTLHVIGMPAFEVGRRQVVFFAHNGTSLCPLVAAGHGRYHIVADATSGRDVVTRDNHLPLSSTDEIALPLIPSAAVNATARVNATAGALSLASFENQITDRLSGGAGTPVIP